jgi:nicotinamide riboside transporter PnuC
MTLLLWITAAASLVAVWINIQRHVACFWIWAVTNAVWTFADATHGLLPQAALQLVYFGLSIYGIAKWRDHGPQAAT